MNDAHPWVTAGRERLRFGIVSSVLPRHHQMRDHVHFLEGLGYDAVFLPDHPLAVSGDPWLALAGCVDATTRIRLGVMVSCIAYRHPAMLARAAADVDRMSGGRVVLGLGTGDMPHEFAMMGLDFGTPRSRHLQLGEALRVIPPLLRGEPVTFEGTGFAVREAVLPFPAVQQPHIPIVLAGGSPRMLRLAAEHADAINIGAASWAGGAYSGDDVADRLARLDEYCLAADRAPGAVLRTGYVGISVAPTDDEARAALELIPPPVRGFFDGFFRAGSPDDVAAYLQKLIDAGYRYLVFFTADQFVAGRGMAELLVKEVLPQLQHGEVPPR